MTCSGILRLRRNLLGLLVGWSQSRKILVLIGRDYVINFFIRIPMVFFEIGNRVG